MSDGTQRAGVRFLQIEPTTRCNFICGFCAGRSMPQTDLSDATFERALASLPDLEHVELQGEGEPMLHPRAFDFIARARARGVKVSFITNGSYLTSDNITRLLDTGVEKISVSLESADPATFRSIRGGKLEKVIAGVEALLAARRERGLDRPIVGMSVTVLASTRDHLADIVALYRRLGLDGGITIQPLERKADYARCYDAAMAAEQLDDQAVGDVWVSFLANKEIRRLQAERSPVTGFFDELMAGWRPGTRRCPWLDDGLYLDRDGRASPCCMVKDAQHSLGSLGDAGGMDAILARRDGLRRELEGGKIPAACDGCDLARFALLGKGEMLYWGVRGLLHRWFGKLPSRETALITRR